MSTTEIGAPPRKRTALRHVLFYTRLFLYLFVFAIPIVHPAVVVPYDKFGWWLWFGLLPLEMLIAYYLRPPRLSARAWAVVATLPIIASVIFLSGISLYALIYLGVGAAAFLVTAAIFYGGPWGRWLALPEPFLLGILYFKMLSFSRASENIAAHSAGITQIVLVVAIGAFLLHSLVLYFAVYRPEGRRRGRAELAVFLAVVVPLVLAVAILLPPTFVANKVVLNNLDKKVQPQLIPLSQSSNGMPGGNLQALRDLLNQGSRGRGLSDIYGDSGNQPGQGQSQQGSSNQLEGVPSDQWNNGTDNGQGQGRQYAVMVVKTPVDPTYAAEGYFGTLDPVAGFEKTPDQPLNDLRLRHLVETWHDTTPNDDIGRQQESISFVSTLPDRVLAYKPYSVEPTVLNNQFYPFSYSYDSVSLMDTANPGAWASVPQLTPQESAELSPYLSVPLTPADKAVFEHYLQGAVGTQTSYFGKLLAILKSFSAYQYQIGFTDDVSVKHLENFLTTTKEGDCTEFSNTATLLARMAGIPARVVTGYLASRDLETPAHIRGLEILREKIKPLQQYPLNELYLVTTADHHSWMQVWMPEYGWVDIETTSFAIPPNAAGNEMNWNVVIPLISGQENNAPAFRVPWGSILRLLAGLVAFAVLLTYAYRYGRELFLLYASRGRGRRALDSLYKLLLIRLVEESYALKSPDKTPIEYARDHPELSRFAEIYTELRFRVHFAKGEHEQLWRALKREYRGTLRRARVHGIGGVFRRVFSLKGLYYRW